MLLPLSHAVRFTRSEMLSFLLEACQSSKQEMYFFLLMPTYFFKVIMCFCIYVLILFIYCRTSIFRAHFDFANTGVFSLVAFTLKT